MTPASTRVLFLIPARGGSKGLPRKNIRPLLGKPLIGWTIETAMQAAARANGRVVVSTDDDEIAGVASAFGAEPPFVRPAHLALDTSTAVDVILHALDFLRGAGETFTHVCLLEPTSPQRDDDDVIGALSLLQQTEEADSVVGVCRAESTNPSFLALKDQNNFIRPYQGASFAAPRRQDAEDVFFFEGSLYVSTVGALRSRRSFYHERTLGYEMPKWKSFEVDDLTDFMIIECLMNARAEGVLR
jgi:CMP-N,N'-diacetyllegionaminic acid synthase